MTSFLKLYLAQLHKELVLGFFIDRGNADSFFEQLVKLNEFVKQEWVAQGNYLSFMNG